MTPKELKASDNSIWPIVDQVLFCAHVFKCILPAGFYIRGSAFSKSAAAELMTELPETIWYQAYTPVVAGSTFILLLWILLCKT